MCIPATWRQLCQDQCPYIPSESLAFLSLSCLCQLGFGSHWFIIHTINCMFQQLKTISSQSFRKSQNNVKEQPILNSCLRKFINDIYKLYGNVILKTSFRSKSAILRLLHCTYPLNDSVKTAYIMLFHMYYRTLQQLKCPDCPCGNPVKDEIREILNSLQLGPPTDPL
jgi:hypothetical protein